MRSVGTGPSRRWRGDSLPTHRRYRRGVGCGVWGDVATAVKTLETGAEAPRACLAITWRTVFGDSPGGIVRGQLWGKRSGWGGRLVSRTACTATCRAQISERGGGRASSWSSAKQSPFHVKRALCVGGDRSWVGHPACARTHGCVDGLDGESRDESSRGTGPNLVIEGPGHRRSTRGTAMAGLRGSCDTQRHVSRGTEREPPIVGLHHACAWNFPPRRRGPREQPRPADHRPTHRDPLRKNGARVTDRRQRATHGVDTGGPSDAAGVRGASPPRGTVDPCPCTSLIRRDHDRAGPATATRAGVICAF